MCARVDRRIVGVYETQESEVEYVEYVECAVDFTHWHGSIIMRLRLR